MIQYKRIGEMLLEAGLLTQEELDHALQTKLGTTLRFGEILTALGYVTEDEITNCLADQYGYRVAKLELIEPERAALEVVPSITALSGLVLPISVTADKFSCVIADPLDVPLTDSLLRMAGRPVEFSLSTPSELFDAIVKAYGLGPKGRAVTLGVAPLPRKEPAAKPTRPRTKRPIKIDPQDDRFALLAALTDKVAA